MSTFPPAYAFLMQTEDPAYKYAEVPDVGGFAISGINSHVFPADYAFIKSIAQADRGPAVANFYEKKFWNPMHLAALTAQSVANRVFDMGVNGGMTTAVRLLQDAINALDPSSGVDSDGHIGPLTWAAANALAEGELLDAFRAQRLGHYMAIVDHDPTKAVYLGTRENPGTWWRRAEA